MTAWRTGRSYRSDRHYYNITTRGIILAKLREREDLMSRTVVTRHGGIHSIIPIPLELIEQAGGMEVFKQLEKQAKEEARIRDNTRSLVLKYLREGRAVFPEWTEDMGDEYS